MRILYFFYHILRACNPFSPTVRRWTWYDCWEMAERDAWKPIREYGIFNDEGLIENGFFSHNEACEAITAKYPGEDFYSARICHKHPEQVAEDCEECNN